VVYAYQHDLAALIFMVSRSNQPSTAVHKPRAPRQRPSARLRVGEILLARASGLETKLIDKQIARFRKLHESYVVTQQAVVEFDARLSAARRRTHDLDATVNDAIETLARTLAVDRRQRLQPFRGYSKSCPSLLSRMDAARKNRTIRSLVAAVLRDQKLSPSSAAAARGLERTLDTLRAELAAFLALEAKARQSRYERDAVGVQWDRAVGVLRRAAIAAVDDGMPHLHAILFRQPLPRYLP